MDADGMREGERRLTMPRASQELTHARREEVVSACEMLYQTRSFREITLKDIAAATTFTRTSIYNYYQSKEEIFLALMQREYERWVAELADLRANNTSLGADAFAAALARSLERRPMLLKLLSMNHFDMEANSREERLVEFKAAYGASIEAVRQCLECFFPEMDAAAQRDFLYAFLPFLYGIYPYTTVSEKQRRAMEAAGTGFVYMTVYEMAYNGIRKLLKN